MLKDREYNITYTAENSKDLTGVVMKAKNEEQYIFVYFTNETKFGVKSIRSIMEDIKSSYTVILVATDGLTPFAQKEISDSYQNIQFFKKNELYLNPTKHVLYSPHEKITGEERSDVLLKYGSNLKKYPILRTSDIICRYYNFKIGDMIKITRICPPLEKMLVYRIVS